VAALLGAAVYCIFPVHFANTQVPQLMRVCISTKDNLFAKDILPSVSGLPDSDQKYSPLSYLIPGYIQLWFVLVCVLEGFCDFRWRFALLEYGQPPGGWQAFVGSIAVWRWHLPGRHSFLQFWPLTRIVNLPADVDIFLVLGKEVNLAD